MMFWFYAVLFVVGYFILVVGVGKFLDRNKAQLDNLDRGRTRDWEVAYRDDTGELVEVPRAGLRVIR